VRPSTSAERLGRFRRDQIGERIVKGYRSVPQTKREVGWADEASIRMIADELW
jgi:hypothetical protein